MKHRNDRGSQNGSMLIFFGVALTALLGTAAIAVDVGFLYKSRREMQIASDAAALAGVRELAADDKNAARQKAAMVAQSNSLAGGSAPLNPDDDVEFGRWSNGVFTPNHANTNAIRVTVRRTEGTSQGPLGLLFGPALGIESTELEADAIAVLSAVDLMLVLDASSSMIHDTVWTRCTKYVSNMCGCGTPNSKGYQPFKTMQESASSFVGDFDAAVDQIAMGEFASTAKNPINRTLTQTFSSVTSAISAISPPTYCNNTRYTNIGDGILKGVNELRSSRARASAAKVMVLLSDGAPTCNSSGSSCGSTSARAAGQTYARQMADSASGYGVVIHTISLGDEADRVLMKEIAAKTGGSEYFAAKASDLDGVFAAIRRRIPVQLVN